MVLSALIMAAQTQTFELGKTDFLLNGQPFTIRAGEMHPARIPSEYWGHRLKMAKALGLNAVSIYIFWNYLEVAPGKFDFKSENRDLGKFLALCKEEGLWVLLRPGPYCCAEWDLGGIPSYLLKNPEIRLRCSDTEYLKASGRYIKALAKVVKPYQVTQGGPILMLQIENEYGSYSNDRPYLHWIENQWRNAGIKVPFYTADGPSTTMLEAGSLPGAAVGLDSLGNDDHVKLAQKMQPGVPVFSSETYSGWLTHWGEGWARNSTENLITEVKGLIQSNRSFSLYMLHGGTNFGFWAGANSGGKGYEPDITSYDYDAPIAENGKPTAKYFALREVLGAGRVLPDVPADLPQIEIPAIEMVESGSIWNLPAQTSQAAHPKSFEALDQFSGVVIYETKLIGAREGNLRVRGLHDFALVLVDDKLVGTLDRREGRESIQIPRGEKLTLVVEGMGRINYGPEMVDRKGITGFVTLGAMTLTQWSMKQLPFEVQPAQTKNDPRGGKLFRGTFTLTNLGDTYFDVKPYGKGIVWVNGHNLGRYWNIGPQFRLFCPASWLKVGENTIVVLDIIENQAHPISGRLSLE